MNIGDISDEYTVSTEQLLNGAVELQWEPVETGTVRLTLRVNDEEIHSGEYQSVFDSGHEGRTQRGKFVNDVQKELEDVDGIDEDDASQALHSWFKADHEFLDDASGEILGPTAMQIIEGTKSPVEIHEAPDENTTWVVKLSFAGRTKELEFDASAMVARDASALRTKIVHNFHERIEIGPDGWDAIASNWAEMAVVTEQTTETSEDAVADWVLNQLANSIIPVSDKTEIENSPAASLVDEGATEVPGGGVDDDVVWVTDDHLVDTLTQIKDLDYKKNLSKTLRRRGELYANARKRSWTDSGRLKVWGISADALGVNVDAAGDAGAPASSEVEP